MEYGHNLFSWVVPEVFLGILIVFLAVAYLIARPAKNTLITFSIGWFFIMLLPQANLYPINSYMAEHWLYLPSIGFFLIAARAILWLYTGQKAEAR